MFLLMKKIVGVEQPIVIVMGFAVPVLNITEKMVDNPAV